MPRQHVGKGDKQLWWSDSLVAPLDIARFAMAYLVIAFIPGYALAALARPRAQRTERIALAIPCAYSLVAVCGLATALLHIPFDLRAYGILAVPVAGIGGVLTWRRRGQQQERPCNLERWWMLPLAVSLIQLGATALIYARDVVPAGYDVLSHVMWTQLIERSHIYPIALLSSHIGDNNGGFYPPVFHATTALILHAAPMASYRAVFLSVVAVVGLLPFALFSYTHAATGSARLAGLAVLASLAFEPLPFFTQGQGLYPFLVSLLIVPALTVTLRDALGKGDRRAATLAALLGIGLFYTHPTEFVTTGLLVLAILPGLLRTPRLWLRACGYGVPIAAAWLAAALPALVAVRNTMVNGAQTEIATKHDFAPPPQVHILASLNGYVQWIFGHSVSYLLLVVTIVGLAWCITRRRLLGLAITQVVLALLFLDSVSYNLLRPFYVISFPWALWERLAATHYWFVLPLAAIGIDALTRMLWRFLRTKDRLFIAIVAAPIVVLGLLCPFGVAVARAGAYAHVRKVVAPADLNSIAWLAKHAAPHAVVVNDADTTNPAFYDVPLDAGRWMPVLGGPQPLFSRAGDGPGTFDDRLYVLNHIDDNPLPPHAVAYLQKHHVSYVFYGAAVQPGAARHLSLSRLLDDPYLRLVHASAAICMRVKASCPTTGSYIFAITPVETAERTVARTSHVLAAQRRLPSSVAINRSRPTETRRAKS